MKQCIEFALDLKLHGVRTVNVGAKRQRDLFVSLDRVCNRSWRRRLRHIVFEGRSIDRSACGHFSIGLEDVGVAQGIPS